MNKSQSISVLAHDGQRNGSDFWNNSLRVIQLVVLVCTVIIILALFVRPAGAELILWNAIIPLLPASFLVSPSLWRSVCPLATLNMLGNGALSRRRFTRQSLIRAEAVGIALLIVLVALRRVVLNQNGPALGILIIVVAVTALLFGLYYSSKAGFCNSICPVLPVEKLYGQHPIWSLQNPRCRSCDACTIKGCYDLGPEKAIAFSMKENGTGRSTWRTTTFGVFASGFPGFIFGYFSVQDAAWTSSVHVIAQIFGAMLVSILLFHVSFRLIGIRIDNAILILGAFSVSLYYWFSGPAIATAFELDPVVGTGIRVATLTLVGFWTVRAFRYTRAKRAASDQVSQPFAH